MREGSPWVRRCRWLVASGQWPVVSQWWSVAGGQWSAAAGQLDPESVPAQYLLSQESRLQWGEKQKNPEDVCVKKGVGKTAVLAGLTRLIH